MNEVEHIKLKRQLRAINRADLRIQASKFMAKPDESKRIWKRRFSFNTYEYEKRLSKS